ncbi:MAG: hypothetical protein IT259_10040 [Saprospiraceae bacterium]|nr:hypothetical protein [Saprospiraceae bacterium]
MQALQELVTIVTHAKLRQAELSQAFEQQSPEVRRLYDLIAEGKINTEENLLAYLYPSGRKSTRRTHIKIALRDFLLYALLQIDLNLPHFHARQLAWFECYRKWAAAKLLLGRNAHLAAVDAAEDVLQQSLQFDFIDLAVEAARALRLYYGSIAGDLKKYDSYGQLVRQLDELYRLENLSEERYTDLVVHYVNTKATQVEVHQTAQQYYAELTPALKEYDSYRLHFCGRLIELIVYTSVNDYATTITVCDSAISFFEQKSYLANIPLQAFIYQEMVCYVQLKDYSKGKIAAARGLKLLEEGTFNWFKYQELLLLLFLHAGEYQEAYEVFQKTIRHKRFKALPGGIQQAWKIFEAYLYYLHEVGRISPEGSDPVFNRFRMARFLNETPLFARDKRGMNIPILIFQILYLILVRRYDDTVDRIDALEKYASRYLKRDDTYRSNVMIKMLLLIPASAFHRNAVARHAEKYLKMLKEAPLDFARQSHDVEIIPYEALWEMALASLDLNIYTRKKAG